jgi:hypothetical protein
MNAKPKSARALRLAAIHCTFSAMDGTDKALLACLIENGDHGTGENCRPGNRNLLDAARLTKRPVDARIDRLVAAGIIERTERGDGRGRASVYRILWRSNHYPDQTPNGEWLIDKPGCVDSPDCKKEPGCVDSHDSRITGLPDGANRAAGKPKPGCQEAETGLPRQPHTRSTPEAHHQPTIHTRASSENELAGWEGWIVLPTTTDLMGIPTEREQQEMKTLASKEPLGFEYLKKAVSKFRNREQGFVGLKMSPWRLFLQQAPTALAIAKTELMDSSEWRRDHIPGEREFYEASIARQTAEHTAHWSTPPVCDELTPEEFLAEE